MKYVLLFFLLIMSASAWSQSKGADGHPMPPKEALEACQGKSENATCTFIGKNNQSLAGTCFHPKTELPLACKPDNAPAPN